MKPAKNQPQRGISGIGVAVATIAFVAAISVVPLHTAVADDHYGDRGHDRDRDHDWRWDHRREYNRYPVYVPAPIYYPRQPSPGIDLVFPIVIH